MTELSSRFAHLLASSAFRLAVAAVAAFLLLSAMLVSVVLWQTNAVLTDQVVATLAAEVESFEQEARGGSPALADAVAARSRPEGPGLYVLIDANARKVAGNLSRMPPELPSNGEGGVFRYRPSSATEPGPASKPERLGVGKLVAFAGGERLLVGRDVEDQLRYAERVKILVIWSFVALLGLGLATALLISRLVLKRIETVNTTAREIMAGDISRRVPVDGSGDELDGLARNLNAMLDRIEQLMSGLREVSDNIAHDLKTPLNRLRNGAEAALREADPQVHRGALERTIENADELIRTFNALLLIARLEASAIDESATAVDLGRLAASVVEFYAPVAEEAGVQIEIEAEEGSIALANRQLVGQAVANLVDNAIKYGNVGMTPAPGPIRVTVGNGPDDVSITVADRGPGIAPADRDRALRRFIRLDTSRSKPGTGLGLSLVAAVARMHGGSIRLDDNAPGPGLKVTLALPRHQLLGAELVEPGSVRVPADSLPPVEPERHRAVSGA